MQPKSFKQENTRTATSFGVSQVTSRMVGCVRQIGPVKILSANSIKSREMDSARTCSFSTALSDSKGVECTGDHCEGHLSLYVTVIYNHLGRTCSPDWTFDTQVYAGRPLELPCSKPPQPGAFVSN